MKAQDELIAQLQAWADSMKIGPISLTSIRDGDDDMETRVNKKVAKRKTLLLRAITALASPKASPLQADWWVVLEESSGLWWGPRSGGYTDLLRAGLYSEADAKRIAKNPSRTDTAHRLADKLKEIASLQHPSERVLSLLSSSRSAPSDDDVLDFLVAYYGFPDRATMESFKDWQNDIRDEVKLIQSWATLLDGLGARDTPPSSPLQAETGEELIAFERMVIAWREADKDALHTRAFETCAYELETELQRRHRALGASRPSPADEEKVNDAMDSTSHLPLVRP